MAELFYVDVLNKFNGDISKWDVSSVKNMDHMFFNSQFNGDISKWNVSNVKNMDYMFAFSKFNQDISKWDVLRALTMENMFKCCPLALKPEFQCRK